MRTTTFRLLAFLTLGGCCFAPTNTPDMPVGPSGPSAPGCPDLPTSIVGSWTRDGFTETYGADGSYTINGAAGTIQWLAPGHALLDVPSVPLHVEYDLALADATTLIAADPNHIGTVYTRSSPAPAIPAPCSALRAAWVGTWIPSTGGPNERYDADGSYAAPGVGRWSFSAPGRLHLVNDNGMTSDYIVAMSSVGTALAVSLPPLAPAGVAYRRGP